MSRESGRRWIAAGMLAACLLLAVPQTTEARVFEPVNLDRGAEMVQPRQEVPLWDRIWSALGSAWDKVSVLIDPEG